MRFLFAAGGTAGHIYPAVAIANQLKQWLPTAEILFIGATGKMELDLVPKEGYPIRPIPVSNFQRKLNVKGILHNMASVKNLALSNKSVANILKEFSPDVVIGTGGYVCYPVLQQAAKRNIPTVLHESNAIPGLTTRRLAPLVSHMLLGVSGTQGAYGKAKNVTYTGIPVREAFLNTEKMAARKQLGIENDKPLVLSFWGSLGAYHMNHAMTDFFELLYGEKDFYHIHATGGGATGKEKQLEALKQRGIEKPQQAGVDIRAFIDDMPTYMAAADLILCRAGASTLAELTALSKPNILVPSPYVTANHQVENAKVFVENGASIMLEEKNCDGKVLYQEVSGLLKKPETMSQMVEKMKALSKPNATEEIGKIIMNLIKAS